MKILCINPNTTEAVTETVLAVCRKLAPPHVSFSGATGRFGARYITNRVSSAIAGHAALDCFAQHGRGADGVLLACFGDPGLLALKEIAPVPVIGLAEASCLMAATMAQRFTIITGGHRWGPMLEEFAGGMGLSSRLASVRTVAPTGGDIHRDPEAAYALLRTEAELAVKQDGAEAV
ncbi:MAG: aspartate/glutamate racemase family protein, partial [Beijerinckiaceae bacterium]